MRNRDPAMVLHHGPGFWLWPIIREFLCSYIFGFSKIGISEIYTNFVFQHLLNIDRPSVCILSMLSYVNIVKSISNINLFWKGNTARVNYTRVYHWYTNKNNYNTIKAQSFHSKIVDWIIESFRDNGLKHSKLSPHDARKRVNRPVTKSTNPRPCTAVTVSPIISCKLFPFRQTKKEVTHDWIRRVCVCLYYYIIIIIRK